MAFPLEYALMTAPEFCPKLFATMPSYSFVSKVSPDSKYLEYDNYQPLQVCAFADCKKFAQKCNESHIYPLHVSDDGEEFTVPDSDLDHHSCCSRKHELCFFYRYHNDLCVCCGKENHSVTPWCCGDEHCKKMLSVKKYFNRFLRYMFSEMMIHL